MLARRASQVAAAPSRVAAFFALNGAHFAVPAAQVAEIASLGAYTPLPCEDPAHLGVVLHRERIIPLVDLGARLGVRRTDPLPFPGLCLFLKTALGEIACPIDRVLGLAPLTGDQAADAVTLAGDVAVFRTAGLGGGHGDGSAR
jgi:chemotaxis signal transduction protein